VPYRAFADESSENVFMLAAWVSSVDSWESLADAWEEELAKSPKIRYFKHHEAKGLSGEFDGWSKQDADSKILSLAGVICAHPPIYGMTSGLIIEKLREDINRLTLPKKKLRSVNIPTDPLQYCSLYMIARILQVQEERNLRERIDFVFDDHSLFEWIQSDYRRFREKVIVGQPAAEIAGTLTSGDDKDIPALQAADLLAGQMISSLRYGRHESALNLLRSQIDIYMAPVPLGNL
jgi:hypothetical protein